VPYLSADDAQRVLEHRERVARECHDSFAKFCQHAWPYVNNSPTLIWNWHHDVVAEHLEAVWYGKIRQLIVDVPPGTSKSRQISILWPAWVWLHDPTTQFIIASHGDKIVQDFGFHLLRLLRSDFYQRMVPGLKIPENSAKTDIKNGLGGSWFGTTPHGQVTGLHGDILIFDDLVEPDNADKLENLTACRWIPETWESRVNNRERAKYVGVGQRISEQDPYQFCIDNGWFSLVLPARYEGGPGVKTMPNGEEILQDVRTRMGENLCAKLLPDSFLDNVERLYPRVFAGQYQQRPAPAGGAIIQSVWLQQRWDSFPEDGTWLLSCDAAFKDSDGSDYVAIQVWVHKGNQFWLVDQIRRKMGFWDTVNAIRALVQSYPRLAAADKIIEDKANGSAIIETLQKEMYGVDGITPEGGKESRAQAVTACFAGGGVWLPHAFRSDPTTTVGMYTHELEVFPAGKNDDQVDATTQALNWFVQRDHCMVKASRNVLQALAGEYTGAPPVITEAPVGMSYHEWRAGQSRR
jgi:predicted phage terminase large subunit-like protein